MISSIGNVWRRRELVWVLICKEFSGRYRQSLLGMAWAVIQPIGLTFFAVLLRSIFNSATELGPATVNVFAAVLPWAFFSTAVIFATASIVRNGAILKKIYFPREIFVLAAVLTSLVDFCINLCLLALLMIFTGTAATLHLLWLPVLVLVALVLAFGVGLFTSSVAVYKRDVMFGMPFLMMFWMFLSPVFYEVRQVPERLRDIYLLNPTAGIIAAFRNVIVEGRAPEAQPLLCAVAVSLAVLVVCYWLFKRIEMRFADVI